MRKLLILLSIAFVLAGCGVSNSANKNNGKKVDEDIKIAKKDEGVKSKKDKKDDKNKDTIKQDDGETKEKSSKTSTSKTETTKNESKNKESSSNKNDEGKEEASSSTKQPTEDKPSEPSKPVETLPPVVEEQPASPTSQQAKADQVFAQINAYRVQNGKEPFTYSTELRSRCDSHSLAMAQREALWHSGDGAECITNYDDPFSAWVSSPPHQKLLLSNNTEAAVGIYYYNGYYYSVFQTRW